MRTTREKNKKLKITSGVTKNTDLWDAGNNEFSPVTCGNCVKSKDEWKWLNNTTVVGCFVALLLELKADSVALTNVGRRFVSLCCWLPLKISSRL